MSKKKKKKKQKKNKGGDFLSVLPVTTTKSKKKLHKKFDDVLDDIECYRIQLAEADKKSRKKSRKKINKKTEEFYTDMESIRCRMEMSKEWEKTGFLDNLINVLNQVAPIIRMIAKLVASLLIAFLSIETVKQKIHPETVSKISKVFNLAMSV